MNISVHIFVWIHVLIFLGYIPRIGIDGTNGNSNLLKFTTLFSKVAAPFYITNVYEASSFSSLFWKVFSTGIEF